MLGYLATFRGLWGPHLIVVPTSCLINWEIEFKKWYVVTHFTQLDAVNTPCRGFPLFPNQPSLLCRCPAFKVLTYYGSQKTRKALRTGWSKPNAFHICVTSYQVVVQDSSAFRRKRWYYMILDEAHNIKVRAACTPHYI
jgi:SNF2 family DNA or RNA helicase